MRAVCTVADATTAAEQDAWDFKNPAQLWDHDAPGASASIHEGLDEMFTVIRLGLPALLRSALDCTKAVESLMAALGYAQDG